MIISTITPGIITSILISYLAVSGKGLTTFSWHPISMSIGALICIPLARLVAKSGDRYFHVSLGIGGALLILAGLVAVYSHHVAKNEPFTDLIKSPKSFGLALHMYGGYLFIILLIFQSISGASKLSRSVLIRTSAMHRKVGRWLPVGGVSVVATTLLFWKRFSSSWLVFLLAVMLLRLAWTSAKQAYPHRYQAVLISDNYE